MRSTSPISSGLRRCFADVRATDGAVLVVGIWSGAIRIKTVADIFCALVSYDGPLAFLPTLEACHCAASGRGVTKLPLASVWIAELGKIGDVLAPP